MREGRKQKGKRNGMEREESTGYSLLAPSDLFSILLSALKG
jgi:hypothetical protein